MAEEKKPIKKTEPVKKAETQTRDTKAQTENTEAQTGYLSFRERASQRRQRNADRYR